MSGIAMFLLVVAIAVSAMAQILTDTRIAREFIAKSLRVMAVYAVHVAAGFTAVWWLLPKGPDATVAFLGWLGLGFLELIGFAPRLRDPPKWLMQVGITDLVCLALIGGGVLSATGLI